MWTAEKKEYMKKWREENADSVREYRRNHREQRLEYNRKWRKAHPNYDRQWCENHWEQRQKSLCKYHKTHIEQEANRTRNWRNKNPNAALAHDRVYRAINKGLLNKPELCSQCNRRTFIHAHHFDYTKPLEVIWLCVSCHQLLHQELNKEELC